VIALDTNVLVRFLVEDDPVQSSQSRALIQAARDAAEPCFVPEVVLCELVWVLSVSYKVPRQSIRLILGQLLLAEHLAFSATDRLSRALASYQAGKGNFADYLILEDARNAGCRGVATFDRALHGTPGFIAPPPP
jgi:predicted nucleic-acid-binding protein